MIDVTRRETTSPRSQRHRSRNRRALAAILAVVTAMSGLTATATASATVAAAAPVAPDVSVSPEISAAPAVAQLSGADFNAGFIISDQLFYQRDALSQAQIQSFLDQKIGTCSNSNCLNVYKTATASKPASSNGVCSAYEGSGWESAAAIIYKVQQACSISAKVLLVTLQKEQGLITATAPTDGKLKIAMGYGCPDTAPCAAEYFGLFNQIYKAAWQFKRYSYPNYVGNYRPGTFAVKYHPNADCGTKTVNIQNNATAALYNYTPYTPNAAALSNLSAAAPPCGSYGNRNFWSYFTNWFGSTLTGAGNAAITAAYANAGGAAGALGAVVSAPDCGIASQCGRTYANGMIGWSVVTGAYPVVGAAWTKYKASGGTASSIGYPAGAVVAITGPNGDGFSQAFENAQIVTSASGTFILRGAIRTYHAQQLWVRGPLGWPTADHTCVDATTCGQPFQYGAVSWSSGSTKVSNGVIGTAYLANGGPAGALGPALNAITAIEAPSGNGSSQAYSGGQIVSSAAGTFVLSGAIRAAHVAQGWVRGPLGWPTGNAVCESGTCVQTFEKGAISSVGTTTFMSDGVIGAKYIAAPATRQTLGAPTGAIAAVTGPNGDGFSQAFQRGQIVSSAAGTFILTGAIKAKHAELLWVRGTLGWPTADPVCDVAGNCTQAFQSGSIVANVGSEPTVVTTDAIGTKYASVGGATGVLGKPAGEVTAITGPNGNGKSQAFQNGQIVSSSSGTFILSGAIRTKHAGLGWVRGALGWPTADAVCSGSACSQTFQEGVILLRGGVAYATHGAIADRYQTAGGAAGSLGAPIGDVAAITGPNGDGSSQAFQNAQIVSSSSGTFVLSGAIRTKHAGLGWVRGALGWPTAEAVCSGSTCSQRFQGGVITVRDNVAFASSGAIATKYLAAGGPAGTLGYPIGDIAAITGPNGNGSSQAFQNAQIVSSASGTFILTGAIRTKHAELLWVRGALGWPKSDASCSGSTCTQTFQKGTIVSSPSGVVVTY